MNTTIESWECDLNNMKLFKEFSQQERDAFSKELFRDLAKKINYYKLNNKKFKSLLDVRKYCKKNKITDGDIYSNLCIWGDVEALLSISLKDLKTYN